MLDRIVHVNLLAVVLATIVSFLLGGIWFVLLFAKKYVVVMGRESLPEPKPSAIFLVGPVVCNLMTILTSALLMKVSNIDSITDALLFGAIISVGYVIATCMNIAINPNFPHPFKYTMLNAPYFLISNVSSTAILFLMR